MKRIWHMAGVGLLMVTVGTQVMADEPRPEGGGQHERGPEGNEQPRPQNNQPRPQNNQPRPENNQPRPQNPHFDRAEQPPHGGGQWQGRPQGAEQPRPAPQPANNLPIQSRPDTVRQTQEPRQGYYRDIPRRNDDNRNWEAGGPGSRPGYNGHPNDNRWPGRPDGHGNGWGPGPQYRPGYVVDRFPDRNYRVPYRGQDYFFSGGYWYRPQGPRYVVVAPPYGIRVHYLPDYAREVWVGGSLLFLAAGAYYAYEQSTQQYVVVQPPTQVPAPQPAPQGNGYDVVAYPANGQSPAQVQQDGYDCYRWAVQQSGFDPQAVTYAPDPAVVQTYRQAQGNCLSSRGYQVQY
ncbi:MULTISPECIES: DUF6515 family protein [Pseudomonas]|jgi:hypothetical protein|uniref:Glycine zipper family protein n=1 Tax=Pseudomonas poae TaxID=200451 RepID=A0A7Z1K1I7_9PSED|nr:MULTISPECIES: DUF6515 family protein [Pseudomonas]KAA8556380.1 hypothetical protein FX984_03030 [Pseudomonas marginalis]PFG61316.1 hypothetical protein DM05_6059 [Pseudomonas poae]PUB42616.1 hypothetical protein C8K58_108160 [Pseudomonas sp. GV047]TWR66915.1 glycine zipper family protein [Pseudomonas marginalis]SCX32247.1 hypothetical protein SAMN03159437_03762 [Pseudomonas sp. NFACC25]